MLTICIRSLLVVLGALVSRSTALTCWSCENARSAGACIEFGRPQICKETEKVCQTELRFSSGWGKKPTIRTGCKEEHACGNNHVQNPRSAWRPTQCNSGKANSVCRCCCSAKNCNKKELLCETAFLKNPPTEPMCLDPVSSPQNGRVICEGSRYAGSRCNYKCDDGFLLIGNRQVTCTLFGEKAMWVGSRPVCRKLPICDPISAPKGGKVVCFGGGYVGSYCVFDCNVRHTMEGSRAITCINTADGQEWTSKPPTCSFAKCEDLGELAHGNVRCTTSNNTLGTTCSFDCGDSGLFLTPIDADNSRCVWKKGRAEWNRPKPCCSGFVCPPTVKKDIVIALDSSGSISSDEWVRMKSFVVHVLGRFNISPNNVQIAMFRFNRKIDTESQILFGDHSSLESLEKAIDNMPKRGGGTYIGQALRHVRDNVLKHPNNRLDVTDMLWILTDGKSNDEFKETALQLRESGVEIVALGISRRGDALFLQQLLEITGDKNLVLEVTDVINSFEDDLVQLATSKICEINCFS